MVDHGHLVLGELDVDLDVGEAQPRHLRKVFKGVFPHLGEVSPVAPHQQPFAPALGDLFKEGHVAFALLSLSRLWAGFLSV